MKKLMTVVLAALSAAVTYGGYTQLSYLKATGNQWIHTGYTPNDTDRIETRVRFTNISGNLFVWCARAAGGSDSYTCMFFSGGYMQIKHGNAGAASSTASSIMSSGEDAVIVANGVTGECSCNYKKQFEVLTAQRR